MNEWKKLLMFFFSGLIFALFVLRSSSFIYVGVVSLVVFAIGLLVFIFCNGEEV